MEDAGRRSSGAGLPHHAHPAAFSPPYQRHSKALEPQQKRGRHDGSGCSGGDRCGGARVGSAAGARQAGRHAARLAGAATRRGYGCFARHRERPAGCEAPPDVRRDNQCGEDGVVGSGTVEGLDSQGSPDSPMMETITSPGFARSSADWLLAARNTELAPGARQQKGYCSRRSTGGCVDNRRCPSDTPNRRFVGFGENVWCRA